ncbi:hypothetical protein C9374_005765 [Naegleria lovaniensis]|uniref:(S)-ureidoglycine aminohydrolase cupin domain-containing protein n=1 Tax=Naegleria lovaniensis TaxID=51637 RepID=A0AA88GPU8_NAELO|nr:uncharacterized protein C9374_005765 [Naegleria lovaniensis]KAG2381973.1 hypothetical protein C9374_005765 [Naegleria lovaniensis]
MSSNKKPVNNVVPLAFSHDTKGEYTPDNIQSMQKPLAMVNNLYTDRSGHMSCGVWSSTKGKWWFDQGENAEEFCVLISGKVRMVADGIDELDGGVHEFKAGDAFIIPVGFRGTWETVEDVKKFYCVFEKQVANSSVQPHPTSSSGAEQHDSKL